MSTVDSAQQAVTGLLSGWDGIFITLFLFVGFLLALILNRSRLVLGTVSLYISAAVLLLAQNGSYPRLAQWLSGSGRAVGTLLTLAVVVAAVLGSSVLRKTTRRKGDKKFSYRLVYAYTFLGLLLSLAIGQLPAGGFRTFSPFLWIVTGSATAQMTWLFLPLIVMLLWRKRR